MNNLDNVKYEKFNYNVYRKRIDKILKNPTLNSMGLKYNILGFTEYNYPIDCITVGYGKKDIFIVGGTHGSEMIGVDFVTQLISNLPILNEFDPSLYKLNFIPLQNPEGFDISTTTMNNIHEEEFQTKSYEYYERYRIDSLISKSFNDLNIFIEEFIDSDIVLTSEKLLSNLKKFINTNKNWQLLCEDRAIPKLKSFIKSINNIKDTTSFEDFKKKIIIICDSIINDKDNISLKDKYLVLFVNELKKGFNDTLIWNEINKNNKKKLHQLMFKNNSNINLNNNDLKKQVEELYKADFYPEGSTITFDANGNGVNLNANTPLNPGIELAKNNIKMYGFESRDNVVKYFKGPIGAPTKDINSFEYEKENKALYRIINESFKKGDYLATFLYHGTGGSIFYKPYKSLMDESTYRDYYLYNKTLASTYSVNTNYSILESSDKTGYGDYLRRTFPGVLLVELSKMGGNPIGPYGDQNNIYNTINDNLKAFNDILKFYNKENVKNNDKHIK